MTAAVPPLTTGNPFATRRVRPGAIPFFFPAGESVGQVLDRLRAAGWWGQVVGPRGSGKSTLVAALLPGLREAGREPLLVVRHRGERALPRATWADLRRAGRAGRALVVAIDGYEQLSPWSRFRVRRRCRRHGHGLLATAHADMGLPDLYRTRVTPEVALRVVGHLTRGTGVTIAAADVTARLDARAGDLRETLFDLYDLHERNARR
jgi:hypothetical protein